VPPFSIWQPARGFTPLERENIIGTALFDGGGGDRVSEFDIGDDGTPRWLCHALRKFDIIALLHQQVAENPAREQRSLPADASIII
jgi:hypothetical protein